MTPRQRQVLELAAQGRVRPQIAADLGIAPDTVKMHVRDARHSLRARNTTHAVAIAIRQGLIT